MNDVGNTWAIVLAAGEGSRLRSLTTTAGGVAVPKQFCSLRGGPSLLQETLSRASAVATLDHTCVVVARQHRVWWQRPLEPLPSSNVIVQPENCGTAIGILLPLLRIIERDPEATLLLLPSDHHVADERTLRASLRAAVGELRNHDSSVILLGLQPDEADPDLGYIVPGASDGVLRRVDRFVEKPSLDLTRGLLGQGALWNVFIVAVRARTLLDLFAIRYPHIVADMQRAIGPRAVEGLYRRLPKIDFSHDILQEFPARLRVLTVPACGWSDLGTPARVGRTLDRFVPEPLRRGFDFENDYVLNLAEQRSLWSLGCSDAEAETDPAPTAWTRGRTFQCNESA